MTSLYGSGDISKNSAGKRCFLRKGAVNLDKYIMRVYTDIVNRTGKPAWRAERKHRLRPFYLMRIMPP